MFKVSRCVPRFRRTAVAFIGGVMLCAAGPCVGQAAEYRANAPRASSGITIEEAATRHIAVAQNKSRTIRFDQPFASTVIGMPEIADVLALSNHVVYIQAKKIGTTNVSVFDADKHLIAVLDVEVTVDTQALAAQIRNSTGVAGIKVGSSNGQIVLSGEARDAVAADRAVQIAKSTTPNSPVINAMRIAASQQVMLKVRFLEVTRSAERNLGVNWFASNASGTRGFNTGLGAVTQAGRSDAGGGIPVFSTLTTFAGGTTGAPFGVALANLVNNGTNSIDVLITALEDKGVVRRLAEPDLVALSGDTASFLAGGEVPVPVA